MRLRQIVLLLLLALAIGVFVALDLGRYLSFDQLKASQASFAQLHAAQARRVHAVPHIAQRGGGQVFAAQAARQTQLGALQKWHPVQRMVKHDTHLERSIVTSFGEDVGLSLAP